jgi:hypothetical protein
MGLQTKRFTAGAGVALAAGAGLAMWAGLCLMIFEAVTR